MPRTKDEYVKMRTEAKNKIMDAAIDVFSKKGFSAASINDIAEAANISGGLVYRYFKSKQDLFDTIIDLSVGGLQGLIQLANSSSTPKETFETVCREMLDSMKDESFMQLNVMIIQGLMSQDSPAYAKIIRTDKKMIDAFAGLIQKGQEQGVFAAGDSVAKTCLFFSAVQGMVLMKLVFKERFKPPAAADMMSFLLK